MTNTPGNRRPAADPSDYSPASRGTPIVAPDPATPQDPPEVQMDALGAFSHAMKSDTITGTLLTRGRMLLDEDPLAGTPLDVTDDMLKEAQEAGVPNSAMNHLAGSRTEEIYNARLGRLLADKELMDEVAEMGGTGTAVRFTAAVVDPVTWLAGPGKPVVTGGRLARAGSMAVRTGAIGAAETGTLAALSPTYTLEDATFGTGAAFLLGGAFGSFQRGNRPHAGMDVEETMRFDRMVEEETRKLSPEARAAEAEVVRVEQAPGASVGAAQVSPDLKVRDLNEEATERFYEAEELNPAYSYAFEIGGKATRIDNAYILGSSDNPLVRQTAALVRDAGGKKDGGVNPIGASEWKERKVQSVMTGYLLRTRRDRLDHLADAGFSSLPSRLTPGASNTVREFGEDVTRFMRDPGTATTLRHKRAAREAADAFRKWGEFARDAGLEGFEGFTPNAGYVPRVHVRSKVIALEGRIGTGNLEKLVAAAIRKGTPEGVEMGDVDAIARGYVRTLKSREIDRTVDQWAVRGGESAREEAVEMLRREFAGEMDDAQLGDIFDLLSPSRKGSSPTGHGKRRLALDETAEIEFLDAYGQPQRARFDDLLENDIDALLARYGNTVMGNAALARMGLGSRADVERTQRDILSTWREVGGGYTLADAEREAKLIGELSQHIRGVPLHNVTPEWNATIDRVRKFNFTRLMNRTGFAQMSELGLATTRAGLGVMVQSLPEFRSLLAAIRKGEGLDDEMMQQIIDHTGLGGQSLRSLALPRYIDNVGNLEAAGNRALDDMLHHGANVTAIGSGLGPITDGLHVFVARETAVQWHKAALRGDLPQSSKRLAHLGVDGAMAERIAAELRKLDTYKARSGRVLPSLRLDRWEDVEAREAFADALNRDTRRIIQTNDIGQLRNILTHPVASLMVQFKTFGLSAYTTHIQHGLNMRDAEAFTGFMMSAFYGGLFYTASTYLAAQGREDKAEYLEERLSPDAIAAATFARSTHSSIFPGAIDMGLAAFDVDPVFGPVKNTGMDTAALFHNPTLDLLDNVADAVGGTARAIVDPDFDFSQQQFRSLARTLPFANAVGIQNLLNIAGQAFPQSSKGGEW